MNAVSRAFAISLVGATLACAAPASASVITSLPGGTALPIPVTNATFQTTPQTIAPGIVAAPATGAAFTFGYAGGYGFPGNGNWSGTSMIGLDNTAGSFSISFANPITAFLGELNWGISNAAVNANIAIYNAAGGLLESLTLENGNVNQVTPGFYGFSRSTAEIAKIVFSQEFIGVRNISIQQNAVGGAVPEPATWGLMLLGFGALGGAMRRRRRTTKVALAG